jgi:hypothetical protein
MPSSLLTPTSVPIFDQAAYMPLLLKDGAPARTAAATATTPPPRSPVEQPGGGLFAFQRSHRLFC